jgi:hypothetical protein
MRLKVSDALMGAAISECLHLKADIGWRELSKKNEED